MDLFQVLFYQPLFNLIVLFTNLFGNIGWAIIAIALLTKLITAPLTKKQMQNSEKSKVFQKEIKLLQKKYKHNPDKLAREMASVQAKALPGQLSGCLSIIIFLILFLQIRSVILDLVNQGYHAYNSVAYSQEAKIPEDSVKYTFTDNMLGEHNKVQLTIITDNGNKIEKVYDFEITDKKEERMEEIKEVILDESESKRKKDREAKDELEYLERSSDISVYSPTFDKALTSITLSQFLIFPTETKQVILLDTSTDISSIEFYIRPPSDQAIDYSQMELWINDVNVTDNTEYTQGAKIMLNFFGMNLSRVASDFGLLNLSITLPYILLSLGSAVSQFFVSRLYTMQSPVVSGKAETKDKKDKDKKGGKKDKKEEVDMMQAMSSSFKQMNFIFPLFTMIMTLGYFGGAHFLPSGVTLFWTAQNLFVIGQQGLANRKKIIEKIKNKFSNINKDGQRKSN